GGGNTTFSTYMLDTRALLVTGQAGLAAEYVGGTLVAGLAAVWAGGVAARLAVRLPRGASRRRPRVRPETATQPPGAGGSVTSGTRSMP
ncbi:MAG TPA: CrcB family protein, partial [Kineosporiaceae bacterium]